MAFAALGLVVALVVVFGALAPPERCPEVTEAALLASSTEVVDWFTRNQEDDGTWLYEYEPATDTVVADYNVVRHSGVALGLYMAASASIPGALESADRGAAWSLDRLLERDDWSAVTYEGQTSAGTTALLVAGLAERRTLTNDTRHDEVLRRLGRFLVAQTEPSGAVLASYDDTAGAPVADVYSKYYTGETYWALARLHRLFPDEGWGEVADRIGAYMAAERDEVEDFWPPLPDHWAAYGLAETVAFDDRPSEQPAHGGRARLRPPPSGALRRPGSLGEPAVRALGRRGPQPTRASRWRLRRRGRGAHRPVASGPGRPSPGGPARPRR